MHRKLADLLDKCNECGPVFTARVAVFQADEQVLEESLVVLKRGEDLDVVEHHHGMERCKRDVVENPRKDGILHVSHSVRAMDLALHHLRRYCDHLLEGGHVLQQHQ